MKHFFLRWCVWEFTKPQPPTQLIIVTINTSAFFHRRKCHELFIGSSIPTVMIQDGMHPSHEIFVNVMKGNALGCTVIYSPLCINTVLKVPIKFGIFLGGYVSQMLSRLLTGKCSKTNDVTCEQKSLLKIDKCNQSDLPDKSYNALLLLHLSCHKEGYQTEKNIR